MKTTRTTAIVLRRTDYGEADRIVQLLTPEGRFSVMARGVRHPKSKLAGGIELLSINDVVLGEGKGDLGILTSARSRLFFGHIMEDYDRLQFAYYAIKQIAKVSEHVNEPDWYDILAEVLAGLDAVSLPISLVETWFYIRVASSLGHDLNLVVDVDGDKLLAEEKYRYDIGEKGLRLDPNGEISAEHIKLLRLISNKSLKVLSQIGGLSETLPIVRTAARAHAAL